MSRLFSLLSWLLAALLVVWGAAQLAHGISVLRGAAAVAAFDMQTDGLIEEWRIERRFIDRLRSPWAPWSLKPTVLYGLDQDRYRTHVWCYGEHAANQLFPSFREVDAFLQRRSSLHMGQNVMVYFREGNPTHAVVERFCGTRGAWWALVYGGTAMALAALLVGIRPARRWWRRKRSSAV